VALFAIMMAMHGKDYYLFPIYPMVFAGGAVALERWLNHRRRSTAKALRYAIPIMAVLLTLPVAPLQLPILSPPRYVAYSQWLGIKQQKTEVHMQSVWPQTFADQIGWEQLTQEVARIYHSLSPEEQAHTGIRASNYGEAGAIDFFGPRYGLPKAICAHQNHFFWGPPTVTPQTIIYLQADPESLKHNCTSVQQAGIHYNQYGMGEENEPIYVCRGPKFTFAQMWPMLKHWN
jgi:hypothetical protein